MKLIRVAIVIVKKVSLDWTLENWQFNFERVFDNRNINVKSEQINKIDTDSNQVIKIPVIASIKLEKLPEVTMSNLIVVPENERRALERAIETVANLIVLTNKTERQIQSPFLSVYFEFENEEEKNWLERTQGLQIESVPPLWKNLYNIPFDDKLLKNLIDRLEGVNLLAESISQSQPIGRYKELVRFFESAFSKAFTQIKNKLNQFLEPIELGYSLNEIQEWINLRHPLTHADKKLANFVAQEADVRNLLPRIEQAAFDVLLNKKEWHSFSKERRNIWSWETAIGSKDRSKLKAKKDTPISFENDVLDEFGTYLFNPNIGVNVPPTFWRKQKENTKKWDIQVEVLP